MEGIRIDFVLGKLVELEKRKYDSIVARGKLWFQVSEDLHTLFWLKGSS